MLLRGRTMTITPTYRINESDNAAIDKCYNDLRVHILRSMESFPEANIQITYFIDEKDKECQIL